MKQRNVQDVIFFSGIYFFFNLYKAWLDILIITYHIKKKIYICFTKVMLYCHGPTYLYSNIDP